MKSIGIIDADLLGRKNHRFPNLALMKISSYYKSIGDETSLVLNYKDITKYDKVFLSKAFVDSKIPINIDDIPNLEYGGTGFFLENAKPLDYEIEHAFPDYSLYSEWIQKQDHIPISRLKYYNDYSIGFTTRGCFRKCDFCVNKNFTSVKYHADIGEFLDKDKKFICLLDDNFLGYKNHRDILQNLIETKRKFQFKQGLDLRLLKEDTAEILVKSRYDGDYIFAFDNIEDSETIEAKLQMWRNITKKNTKLYTLAAYKSQDIKDIEDMFIRIKILLKYSCMPYIMRYQSFKLSEFRRIYTHVARWCNQPAIIKRMSFREFCTAHGSNHIAHKTMIDFEKDFPEIAKEYFDIKFKTK